LPLTKLIVFSQPLVEALWAFVFHVLVPRVN
jgi:hypothetical protein